MYTHVRLVAAKDVDNNGWQNVWTVEEVKRWLSLEVRLGVFPQRVFESNLTTLLIASCDLAFLPRQVAVFAPSLNTLSLVDLPLLTELPDLTPLLKLTVLTVKCAGLARVTETSSWHATRESLLLYRRDYHYGGVRKAIWTLLCIRKYCSDSLFTQCVAREVVLLIAKRLWESRASPVWKTVNKLAYDMERFHCSMPVPFVSALGPSCFQCQCGEKFGDPEQPLDAKKMYEKRAIHFSRKHVYSSDDRGRCTEDSLHYPLNRAVQHIMAYPHNEKATERKPLMVDEVLRYLCQARCNVWRAPRLFGNARANYTIDEQVGKANTLYPCLIKEDIEACIDDYLRLKPSVEERWAADCFGFDLFEQRAIRELNILRAKQQRNIL
jgi:hypothetical protein